MTPRVAEKRWVKEHGSDVAYCTFGGHKYLLCGIWNRERDARTFAKNQWKLGKLARIVPIYLVPTLPKKELVKRYAVYGKERKKK